MKGSEIAPDRNSIQDRMDTAFDQFFALSAILQSDIEQLLDSETDSEHWRRNFLRASASLVEGYTHSLRELCSIGLECETPPITKTEKKVVESERSFSAAERTKLTLRAAHSIFELDPAPDFGGVHWTQARLAFEKRDQLMHPKNLRDLKIAEEDWIQIRGGVVWLFEKLFGFFDLLKKRHTE